MIKTTNLLKYCPNTCLKATTFYYTAQTKNCEKLPRQQCDIKGNKWRRKFKYRSDDTDVTVLKKVKIIKFY